MMIFGILFFTSLFVALYFTLIFLIESLSY